MGRGGGEGHAVSIEGGVRHVTRLAVLRLGRADEPVNDAVKLLGCSVLKIGMNEVRQVASKPIALLLLLLHR